MKKEWILTMVSVTVTLALALLTIRWLAPQYLGIPIDLQTVRVAKKVPPFFDNIFRDEDTASEGIIIQDPYCLRAKPMMQSLGPLGPHDVLGFRNWGVPAVADVITIGDSQTYGNNVGLELNWPSRMTAHFQEKPATLYNMSVGGWGAAEYYEISDKLKFFSPRVVVVAFYTGNDPMESFVRAYGNDRWEDLRPDPGLSAGDAPEVVFPPPRPEWLNVLFPDGVRTIFTPLLRHTSNKDIPAVRAGYAIMEKTAKKLALESQKANAKIVFTIIPTKELVYAEKMRLAKFSPGEKYLAHVRDEKKNLDDFAKKLAAIPGAVYVDVLKPLQKAALAPTGLYPESINGHPMEPGYDVIGKTLAQKVEQLLPKRPDGPVLLTKSPKDIVPLVIRDNRLMGFSSFKVLLENGWKTEDFHPVQLRDIQNIPAGKVVSEVDPEKYGP